MAPHPGAHLMPHDSETYPRQCQLPGCEAVRTGPREPWRLPDGTIAPGRQMSRADAEHCTHGHKSARHSRRSCRRLALGKILEERFPELAAALESGKDPAAVVLGRRGAAARNRSMTPAERSAAASHAARARRTR